MPLLDHFHPPLHGPRRWEGFHHAWATNIAQQLNQDVLPPNYFAEPEINIGPELAFDTAAPRPSNQPMFAARVDFSCLDACEIRVYQELGGAELRAAIEIVSPANKDQPGNRQSFAAKCANYLKHGIGVVIVDTVTSRSANLHEEIFAMLEVKSRRTTWTSPTGLYAVGYRAVTVRKAPRIEVWPEPLAIGAALPIVPLWLALDLCVPVHLEESYVATCRSLRISA